MKKELIIEVKRKYKKANYTIGALYINGQWICDTLEPRCIDWNKEKKWQGETRSRKKKSIMKPCGWTLCILKKIL